MVFILHRILFVDQISMKGEFENYVNILWSLTVSLGNRTSCNVKYITRIYDNEKKKD